MQGNNEVQTDAGNIGETKKDFSRTEIKKALKTKAKGDLIKIIVELAEKVDAEKAKIDEAKACVINMKRNNWITDETQISMMEALDGKK